MPLASIVSLPVKPLPSAATLPSLMPTSQRTMSLAVATVPLTIARSNCMRSFSRSRLLPWSVAADRDVPALCRYARAGV
ncbi:hypothetical protein D3C83_135430 [compost metagenome]